MSAEDAILANANFAEKNNNKNGTSSRNSSFSSVNSSSSSFGTSEQQNTDLLSDMIPDLQKIVLSYLSDDVEESEICIMPGMTSDTVLEKNKFYVEFKDNELKYRLNGIFSEKTITQEEMIKEIGKVQSDLLYKALKENDLQKLQPFQDVILKIASVSNAEAQNKAVQISGMAHKLFQPNLVSKFLELLTSGKIFKDISAIQYASWAYDMHMLKMLLDFVPDGKKQKVSQQLEELETKGTAYGKHFDFIKTRTAYQTYIDHYDAWDYQQCQAHWCGQVGGTQRDWPSHLVEEMCFHNRPFDPVPTFKENNLPRGAVFFNGAPWFPLMVGVGVGFDFACYRFGAGRARGGGGAAAPGGGVRLAVNLAALGRLYEVRTLELTELKQLLLNLAPAGSLRSSPS
jgi:predicted RNA-binding protein with EMAP domain